MRPQLTVLKNFIEKNSNIIELIRYRIRLKYNVIDRASANGKSHLVIKYGNLTYSITKLSLHIIQI